MTTSDSTRLGCATVYGALYAVAVVVALLSGGGATGGMAFVYPVLLGMPWTLLLGLLLLIPQIPAPLMVALLVIVPPAINLLLIFRIRGIVRTPHESPRESPRESPHPPRTE